MTCIIPQAPSARAWPRASAWPSRKRSRRMAVYTPANPPPRITTRFAIVLTPFLACLQQLVHDRVFADVRGIRRVLDTGIDAGAVIRHSTRVRERFEAPVTVVLPRPLAVEEYGEAPQAVADRWRHRERRQDLQRGLDEDCGKVGQLLQRVAAHPTVFVRPRSRGILNGRRNGVRKNLPRSGDQPLPLVRRE